MAFMEKKGSCKRINVVIFVNFLHSMPAVKLSDVHDTLVTNFGLQIGGGIFQKTLFVICPGHMIFSQTLTGLVKNVWIHI